jgi:hypothetical protein
VSELTVYTPEEQVARLAARHADITAQGAKLYAIGNGAPPFAAAFLEEMPVAFEVFTDPGRETYRELGMKRSLLGNLSPAVLKHGARAARKGHRQTRVRGDAHQNGGLVILDQDGGLVFRHVEAVAGDLVDLDEVVGALAALRARRVAC